MLVQSVSLFSNSRNPKNKNLNNNIPFGVNPEEAAKAAADAANKAKKPISAATQARLAERKKLLEQGRIITGTTPKKEFDPEEHGWMNS